MTPHQRDVPERFARDMSVTAAEWALALRGGVGAHRLQADTPGRAVVHLAEGGRLVLHWHELPPLQIALMRLARLRVEFAFDGVDAERRSAFMRHFDRYTQRGGG
jgi:hypothetical protein